MPAASHSISRTCVCGYAGIICVVMALLGCQSGELRKLSGQTCSELEAAIDLAKRIDTLNLLSEASMAHCDNLPGAVVQRLL